MSTCKLLEREEYGKTEERKEKNKRSYLAKEGSNKPRDIFNLSMLFLRNLIK